MGSHNTSIHKIRIVHLTTDSAIGGTERMILAVANNLDANRFSSFVVTLKGGGPLERLCTERGIPFASVNMRSKYDIIALFKLLPLLKSLNADVLHTYLFHANVVGRIIGRLCRTPVVISGQRNIDGWRKWYHNLLDKITARWCDLIISNSEAGKQFLIESVGLFDKKISVVHNGIAVSRFMTASKSQTYQDTTVIVCVASLRPKKGHRYLLEAVTGLKHPFELYLIGSGSEESSLKALCRSLNIDNHVHFEGVQDDVVPYLHQADIFILPSLWEGLPVALMEAMCCGVACIATDVGGVNELIAHEKEGLLIEPGSVQAIQHALHVLISDADKRKKLGYSAQLKIETCFSQKKMIESLEALYQHLYEEKQV